MQLRKSLRKYQNLKHRECNKNRSETKLANVWLIFIWNVGKLQIKYYIQSSEHVGHPPYNIPASSDEHAVHRWKFNEEDFFNMRFQLHSLLSIDTPHMNYSVLTSWHNVFGVGSKGAFNDGRLV